MTNNYPIPQIPSSFSTSAEAIAWIVSLTQHGIKPGLARMHVLMEKLNHPERRLRFIHVAGTNGKGSTCAFLANTLIQSRYDVGSFTSPYIEKYTDRIQYNGHPLEDHILLNLCNQLKPIVDDIANTELGSPTMFEVSTALAIVYFATVVHPDYVVWETGLGGRLDSTNIVYPVVTVITNVGYDHMDILGDRLEDIAKEKAGILKPGVPLITAIQSSEARMIVEQIAKDKQVTMYAWREQFDFHILSHERDQQTFHFRGPFREIPQVTIALNGEHQIQNAAVAIMTLEVLRQYNACLIDDEDLLLAMRTTSWPGRLEMIASQPPVLLDGAHNPEGAQVLAHALHTVYPHQKLHLLVGMLATKNHYSYFQHILPQVHTLILTEPDFPKKADAYQLAKVAQTIIDEAQLQVQVIVQPNWQLALQQVRTFQDPDDLLVVTGSLYLVSDVRASLLNQSASEKGW
jgi:dihydrofolate synthase/folylpolyglutamate synthase